MSPDGDGAGSGRSGDAAAAAPEAVDTDAIDIEDIPDLPVAGDGAEQARSLRRLFGRHAVDVRPLSVLAFRRLLIGNGTSFLGSVVTQVAVPVQVYALSHSSLYVGFVGLAGLVPIVLFGLYGGAIADAVDRRRLYFWSSIGSWTVTLALLAQTLVGAASVALILCLVAVQSGCFAIASSARGAIIPRIVPRQLVPAANTLNFTVGNIGMVIGPLVAGVLVDLHHGFAYAYSVDAVSFTAALYSALRLPPMPPSGEQQRPGLRAIGEGLRFIAQRPVLVMSFVVDIVAMVLAMPRSLFPAIAAERFHGTVGPLYAAIAIGSVAAGLSSGWIGRVRRQGRALVFAIVGWGAAVALSGLATKLWLVVVLLAFAGAADLISSVYRQTILQTYAPDELRGRMQGVFTAVVAGGPRLGDVRAGVTAAATGAAFSWTAGGIACIVVVLIVALFARQFWRYDSSTVAVQTSATAPPASGPPSAASPASGSATSEAEGGEGEDL